MRSGSPCRGLVFGLEEDLAAFEDGFGHGLPGGVGPVVKFPVPSRGRDWGKKMSCRYWLSTRCHPILSNLSGLADASMFSAIEHAGARVWQIVEAVLVEHIGF